MRIRQAGALGSLGFTRLGKRDGSLGPPKMFYPLVNVYIAIENGDL